MRKYRIRVWQNGPGEFWVAVPQYFDNSTDGWVSMNTGLLANYMRGESRAEAVRQADAVIDTDKAKRATAKARRKCQRDSLEVLER